MMSIRTYIFWLFFSLMFNNLTRLYIDVFYYRKTILILATIWNIPVLCLRIFMILFFLSLLASISLCLSIFVCYVYHFLSNCFNLLVLFSPHSLWLCQVFPNPIHSIFSAGSISFHLAVSNLFIRCIISYICS